MMNNEDAIESVHKLSFTKDDILIIKIKKQITTFQSKQIFNDFQSKLNTDRIIVIGNNIEISSVPEKNMNELGWYRK